MLTRKRADEVLVAALTGAKIQLAPAETKEILLEILKVYQRDCTKKIDNVRFRELYPHDVVAFEDSRAHAEKLEQALRQSTDAEVSTLISGNDAQLCLKKMYQFFTAGNLFSA